MADAVPDNRPGLWWGDSSGRIFETPPDRTDVVLYWNGAKVAYVWRAEYFGEAGYVWTVMGMRKPDSTRYLIPFASSDLAMTHPEAVLACQRFVENALNAEVLR